MNILMVMRGVSMFRGGGETYFLNLGLELKNKGVNVEVLSSKPMFRKFKLKVDGFDTTYLRSPYLRSIGEKIKSIAPEKGIVGKIMRFSGARIRLLDLMVYSVLSAIWLHGKKDYDFIVLNGLAPMSGLLKMVMKNRVIVFYPGIPNSWDKHGLSKADAVFTDGGGYDELKKINRNTKLIINGVDTKVFRPLPTKRNSATKFIFVGRLVERKNVEFLIDCFVEATLGKNAFLEVVGGGPLLGRLESQYKQNTHVKFWGVVTPEKVPELYKNNNVFLLASKYDSSPNVIFEAMSAGLYVISTDVGGISRIVEHGVNGVLVKVGDKESYISAIKNIIGDEGARIKISSVNRNKILDNYTWSRVAEEFLAITDNLNK